MIGQINQLAFDPQVPRTGTIRETLGWMGTSPGTTTHTFYLVSMYGEGTTVEDFGGVVAYGYITSEIFGPGQSKVDDIDTFIPEDAPLGTYACLTMIAESIEVTATGISVYGIYDAKLDPDVLTITPGLSATIVSTNFSSI